MNQRTLLIYDSLAPYYRQYSRQKSAYLNAVDRLIIKNIPCNPESMLDVGAGDGIRGMIIAQKSKIKKIVLSDVSYEMIKRCNSLGATEVWHTKAENLPHIKTRFDVILCLWNVLGHIDSASKRIKALKKMKFLLSDKGRIFIDVNNRYNTKAYGWIRVLWNMCLDSLLPGLKRGDVKFIWKINNQTIPSYGHFFIFSEVDNIFAKAKLKIENKYFINYTDGSLESSMFAGQLFYILKS